MLNELVLLTYRNVLHFVDVLTEHILLTVTSIKLLHEQNQRLEARVKDLEILLVQENNDDY